MKIQSLRELWKITEMRDGAVYRTEFVERVWTDLDARTPEGHIWVPLSSQWLEDNGHPQTMRRVK